MKKTLLIVTLKIMEVLGFLTICVGTEQTPGLAVVVMLGGAAVWTTCAIALDRLGANESTAREDYL